ncbi:MAG: trimethylamine methyltransferase family protein [Gammaproteobacteria bacterium]|nr:trimethylamine methyltransferase family protein [Gammaproteobacteria bacterium]
MSGSHRRRRSRRQQASVSPSDTIQAPAYITRKIPEYELLGEEGLALIEANADKILEEIGINFCNNNAALTRLKQAGAAIDGERVRFPKGLCRKLIQDNAPKEFTQHARNPLKNVIIGGKHTVLVPAYGSPFVRNLDEGRRYATIEDFINFIKLAYMTPHLHHSGGTICEPVDLPVNKRHFDMLYSHIKYSDKPFMGSVTAPERAEDTVEICKILFGDNYLDNDTGKPKTITTSLINANSPMTYDDTMLGALTVYARNNQATIISPFILAGAMSPVSVAGTATQALAEGLAGMAYAQLVNPGTPVIFGCFASSISMTNGAPTFGTPEPSLILYLMASLSRRLGVPFRSGGGFNAAKTSDTQAGYESANSLLPAINAGVNFMLHTAGWLEGGLVMGYEKFIMDCDQAGMLAVFANGIDLSENGQALSAIEEVGPGDHYLGCTHTKENFRNAFYRSPIMDNNSFEQWHEDGELNLTQRANAFYKKQLADYQPPELDADIDAALCEYIKKRKKSFPDSNIS